MRTKPVSMRVEEYDRQPRLPGWKCEYWDGKMRLEPRPSVAIVRCETAFRPVSAPEGFCLRPVTLEDASHLTSAFFDAFRESVDYWGYTQTAIRKSARDSVQSCFAGKRGAFHSASFLAVAPTRRSIAGAALIVEDVDGPNLDLLFVRPQWQRLGLATALTQSAMNVLHELGEPIFDSAHDVANDASGEWHRGFGFIELPDLTRAKDEAACARHELRRREAEGMLSSGELRALAARAAHWKHEVAALEAIAERDGYEAVSPILRRGRARKRAREGANNNDTDKPTPAG